MRRLKTCAYHHWVCHPLPQHWGRGRVRWRRGRLHRPSYHPHPLTSSPRTLVQQFPSNGGVPDRAGWVRGNHQTGGLSRCPRKALILRFGNGRLVRGCPQPTPPPPPKRGSNAQGQRTEPGMHTARQPYHQRNYYSRAPAIFFLAACEMFPIFAADFQRKPFLITAAKHYEETLLPCSRLFANPACPALAGRNNNRHRANSWLPTDDRHLRPHGNRDHCAG